ncbi:MAG TPA: hypothetical protein VJA47_00580 [archaeon]|nr:hypothetical protein [archaeon]
MGRDSYVCELNGEDVDLMDRGAVEMALGKSYSRDLSRSIAEIFRDYIQFAQSKEDPSYPINFARELASFLSAPEIIRAKSEYSEYCIENVLFGARVSRFQLREDGRDCFEHESAAEALKRVREFFGSGSTAAIMKRYRALDESNINQLTDSLCDPEEYIHVEDALAFLGEEETIEMANTYIWYPLREQSRWVLRATIYSSLSGDLECAERLRQFFSEKKTVDALHITLGRTDQIIPKLKKMVMQGDFQGAQEFRDFLYEGDTIQAQRKDKALNPARVPYSPFIEYISSGISDGRLDVSAARKAVKFFNKDGVSIDDSIQMTKMFAANGYMWDPKVSNPVEYGRPRILYGDSKEYQTEMEKLLERFYQ